MMQTSDLNHNPMHSSHVGEIGKYYRSRILLRGRIYLRFLLPAQYYINAHQTLRGAVSQTIKSPAVEVSGSDIEPNCVRWAVLVFLLRNSTEMDSFPETAKVALNLNVGSRHSPRSLARQGKPLYHLKILLYFFAEQTYFRLNPVLIFFVFSF